MRQLSFNRPGRSRQVTDLIGELLARAGAAIAMLALLLAGVLVAGCGGGSGSGVSSQTVSGVAATGAPLVGQVTLRDSSATRKDKQTVIANDGSFSIDVSYMKAPFLLKATGTVDGANHTLFSFADKPGIANINPLSNAALASAAGVDDPATVFDQADAPMLDKIRYAMAGSVNTLKFKLKILLDSFGAAGADPLKGPYSADHTGLDGMFDNVNITVVKGTFTVTNATTGAVIFTARVSDVANGRFTDNNDDLPKPGPRPAAPTGVAATGGDGQVSISWDPVADATSYSLFYSTKSMLTEQDDSAGADAKQEKNVTSPFVLTGLSADTTYYFIVKANNKHHRGPASAEISATTATTTPAPTVPAAPAGVAATGGTQQVTVSWSTVSGATTYNLYWSTASGVTTANGNKISGVTSPAVHTELANNTTYFYIVTAKNSAGESDPSVQVAANTLDTSAATTLPAAPADVTASGGALYTQYCAGCHGPLGSSDKQGASAAWISGGIAKVGVMDTRFNATTGTLIRLTPEQIAAIAAALQ